MASLLPPPEPVHEPPNENERGSYYFGLIGHPMLVARSSTDPWIDHNDGWPARKALDAVGQHPIVALWNVTTGSLRAQILQAVKDINWKAIDILRIGFTRKLRTMNDPVTKPVTMLVSVEPGSTSWHTGIEVVLRCRQILRQHGIQDVEVELKESRRVDCNTLSRAPETAPKLVTEAVTDPIELTAQLTEFLGTCIASAADNERRREGTKGIYLRDKKTGKMFALTCRHVLIGDKEPNIDTHHDDTAPRLVIQPGDRFMDEAKASLDAEIGGLAGKIAREHQPGRRPVNIAEATAEKKELENLKARFEGLDDYRTRIIGHVFFSPKYDVVAFGPHSPEGTRLRDWALIELHQNKHQTPFADLKNSVVVGDRARIDARKALTREFSAEERAGLYTDWPFDSATNTVELFGTVHEDEMRNPTMDSLSLDEKAILVSKFGRKSQLTFGLATEVKSVNRIPFGDEEFISEEWCILGQRSPGEPYRGAFSAEGDSGSCIWDMHGRHAGMLTSGLTMGSGSVDVSYATPVDWLLKDIRQFFPDLKLV